MRRPLAAAAGLVAGVLLVQGDTLADDAGADAARRAKAVAVLGAGAASRTIAVGDVEDRLAAMPGFQRGTFGGTADGIRRRFLDEVLLREAVLALGAQAARLEAQPAVANFIEDIVRFIQARLPEHKAANRRYLTLAVGCTGGQHRSVYIVEQLAARIATLWSPVAVRHTALADSHKSIRALAKAP